MDKNMRLNKKSAYLNYLHILIITLLCLVLEYNNFICNKKEWTKIFITNNDKIEIVTIVGGG